MRSLPCVHIKGPAGERAATDQGVYLAVLLCRRLPALWLILADVLFEALSNRPRMLIVPSLDHRCKHSVEESAAGRGEQPLRRNELLNAPATAAREQAPGDDFDRS